jgi:hypothetical protein
VATSQRGKQIAQSSIAFPSRFQENKYASEKQALPLKDKK